MIRIPRFGHKAKNNGVAAPEPEPEPELSVHPNPNPNPRLRPLTQTHPPHHLQSQLHSNGRYYFVVLVLWNCCGYDSAGMVAAEVRDPKRTYPKALWGQLVLSESGLSLNMKDP